MLLSIFLAAALSSADLPLLDLTIGGGIAGAGPNFYVTLLRGGRLTVRKTSLPIVAPGKLTETSTAVNIAPREAGALVRLAQAADDFGVGCERAVTDGTSAHLLLRGSGQTVERTCFSAGEWPNGRKTKAFLKRLNAQLPPKLRVF